MVNADSFEELSILNNIARKANILLNVGLRVKADVDAKLGMSYDELTYNIDILQSLGNLNIISLHSHAGTAINDIFSLEFMLDNICRFYHFLKNAGLIIKIINLGGGFLERANEDLEGRFALYKRKLIGINSDIYFEPGRFIIGDAAKLVCKVHRIKHSDKILLVNTTACLYKFSKATQKIISYLKSNESSSKWSIGGIWPSEADIIRNVEFPDSIKVGDNIVFENAGAYTLGMLSEYSFSELNVRYID